MSDPTDVFKVCFERQVLDMLAEQSAKVWVTDEEGRRSRQIMRWRDLGGGEATMEVTTWTEEAIERALAANRVDAPTTGGMAS